MNLEKARPGCHPILQLKGPAPTDPPAMRLMCFVLLFDRPSRWAASGEKVLGSPEAPDNLKIPHSATSFSDSKQIMSSMACLLGFGDNYHELASLLYGGTRRTLEGEVDGPFWVSWNTSFESAFPFWSVHRPGSMTGASENQSEREPILRMHNAPQDGTRRRGRYSGTRPVLYVLRVSSSTG